MSFVGKMLVVLQVVLSVCFMAFAGAVFATHTSWKLKHDNLNAKFVQANTDLNTATTQLETGKSEHKISMDVVNKKADTLTADVQKLESENKMLVDRQESQERNANVAQEQARIAQQEAADRSREATELRKQNKTINLSRDEGQRKLLQREDSLRAEQEKVATLNESLKEQLRNIVLFKKVLRRLNVSADPKVLAAQQEPPQAVDGKVRRVTKSSRGTVKLLEISIGSDDGLVQGHVLIVYRGDKFLGKIRIVDTSTDKAVAEVVSTAKTGLIKEGDIVTTKL